MYDAIQECVVTFVVVYTVDIDTVVTENFADR